MRIEAKYARRMIGRVDVILACVAGGIEFNLTLQQSSHGFATRVHGFATKTKALEIPPATPANVTPGSNPVEPLIFFPGGGTPLYGLYRYVRPQRV